MVLWCRAGLKEAVRLSYGAQLEALLGQPQDQQAGLRISLTAAPPPGAKAEAAWLAGGQQQHQSRRGRHGGRGRGGRSQQEGAGEAAPTGPVASEALVRQLAAMSNAEFLAACPASAAALAPLGSGPAMVRLQAGRRPIHVGGRYLKLRRSIPQVRGSCCPAGSPHTLTAVVPTPSHCSRLG